LSLRGPRKVRFAPFFFTEKHPPASLLRINPTKPSCYYEKALVTEECVFFLRVKKHIFLDTDLRTYQKSDKICI